MATQTAIPRRSEKRQRPGNAQARLTAEEMERLQRAAAARQVSVSSYVRELIVRATSTA